MCLKIDELQRHANDTESRINSAELAPPLTTALQISIFRALERLGVIASAVVGHSSGEIAAAYAAGLLSMDEAITIAYYYGQAAAKSGDGGAMAAVGLGVDEVTEFLSSGVVVACDNSPSSVTLAGHVDAIDEVLFAIKSAKPDVSTSRLKVEAAYHSRKRYHCNAIRIRILIVYQPSWRQWQRISPVGWRTRISTCHQRRS
jgi:acyl transferase domain-containing protein